MEQIIAADVGTTGAKVALISRTGDILAREYASYETTARQSRMEQNPNDWWDAVRQGILRISARVDRTSLRGIVLGGQMQDLIPLDVSGLLAPAILYSDTRAKAEILDVQRIIGEDRLKRVTGNIQDASSLLAKLLWLKYHQSELYSALKTILFGAHDYIAWKLTGRRSTDFTTAATTGLLDIQQNQWAGGILTDLDLRTDILPQLVPADTIDGHLAGKIADSLRLPAGCPVFHGSGDVGTSTLGSNAGIPGTTSCYLGTSGWIASTTDNVFADPDNGIYNLRHPDPSRVIEVGPMLLAGGNIQWIAEQIGDLPQSERQYALLHEKAAEIKPGANGVLYFPYLCGERSPFKAPEARGGFMGLSTDTMREELYRAALEGVAFAMRSIQESISGPDFHLHSITLSGGGAQSLLWPQIFSDVFQCDVIVLENAEEVGLIGATLLCGKALGWYPDYRLPVDMLHIQKQYTPKAENVRLYHELYTIFRQLYPLFMESWSALNMFREQWS